MSTINQQNTDQKNDQADDPMKMLENVLDKYYKNYNRNDYFDANNEGKLYIYWEENGFGDDELHEELKGEFDDDLMIVDFDDDFPFGNPKHPHKPTKQDIFHILKQIYNGVQETSRSSLIAPPQVKWHFGDNSTTDQKFIETIRKKYKTICPAIKTPDPSLSRALSVGVQNDYPYLQFLADMWQRERVTNKKRMGIETIRSFSASKWAAQNPHLKKLQSIQIPYLEPFKAACDALYTWERTIHSHFRWEPSVVIDDSLQEVSEYISCVIDFILQLIKTGNKTCPFQFDCCFVSKMVDSDDAKTVDSDDAKMVDSDSDDAPTGLPDDPDYLPPIDLRDNVKKVDTHKLMCMGNIKKRIKDNNLFYHFEQVNDQQYAIRKKFFRDTFRDKFKRKIELNKYKTQYGNNINHQYPHNRRFCAVIDRRKPDTFNNMNITIKDELIFFEPPDNCNKLPNDADMLPEWYFNSIKTCIIPQITRMGLYTALSFHATSCGELRCYLYYYRTVIRFFPKDIITILPEIFAKTPANLNYIKQNHAKELVDKIGKFPDPKFNNFYSEYSGSKIDWE